MFVVKELEDRNVKRKRSILLGLAAIGAVGGGAYFFSAARTHAEVERLIGEAHGRGIYTSPVTPARNQYLGANAATKFAGIERLRELRALDVEPQNIGTARSLRQTLISLPLQSSPSSRHTRRTATLRRGALRI